MGRTVWFEGVVPGKLTRGKGREGKGRGGEGKEKVVVDMTSSLPTAFSVVVNWRTVPTL
jgi:hypothetical protein